MRTRRLGLFLVGLGAFALVAALLVRVVLAPDLVKLPREQRSEPTASAGDVAYWDFAASRQLTGLDATANQVVEHVESAPDADSDVSVWSSGTAVVGSDDGVLMTAYEYTVCLDRRTARSVADCDSARGTDGSGAPEGLTLTFPFHTEKIDYDYYNPSTDRAFPARYEGEDEVGGVPVYVFVQDVPETVIRSGDVTGAMLGDPTGPGGPAEIVYTNQRTMWVEPLSGVIVSAAENPESFVRGADGTRGVTILSASLTATEQTVRDGAARAEDTRGKILLVERTLPLVLLVVGVLALLALVIRALRR